MKILIVESALGYSTEHDGRYIVSFEPDVDELGRGRLVTTPNVEEARDWPDPSAAFEFWRQRSKRVPLRPDGKPNRPLTAYTVMFE
jgi:hypothetical protein